jgi:hypothetical protein
MSEQPANVTPIHQPGRAVPPKSAEPEKPKAPLSEPIEMGGKRYQLKPLGWKRAAAWRNQAIDAVGLAHSLRLSEDRAHLEEEASVYEVVQVFTEVLKAELPLEQIRSILPGGMGRTTSRNLRLLNGASAKTIPASPMP